VTGPAAAIVMIVIAYGATASAQTRHDTVMLLNGDRLTGEIMKLDRGRLELKTDDAGTIDIEWDKVATAESAAGFEIETADGRRLLGSLARASERQSLQVTTAEGGVPLAMSHVTRVTPIGASFRVQLLAVERHRADDAELEHGVSAPRLRGTARRLSHAHGP
jgi:hypothetical protein